MQEIELDPWQKEILSYQGHVLLCTGRQVGKTTIFARKAAEYMLAHAEARIIVVSLTEDQAQLMIIMVLDYLEKNHKKLIAKGSKKPTKNRIWLTNKAQILARPVGNTGDAVRGFTGDVLIIDEASRMPELMWTAARPTLLTTGGEIWMCSTPFGKQGYFYECFENKAQRYKVFHISSEEVISKRALSEAWTQRKREAAIKFLEEEKKSMSATRYGQEYLGKFMDDLNQYFSDELIDTICCLDKSKVPRPSINREYFLGVDIARMGSDETAFEIVKKIEGGFLEHVYSKTTTKTLTTQTEDTIITLNQIYNFKKVYLDAGSGSLGVGIFDHLLRHPKLSRKVEAINNRQIVQDRAGKKKQRLLKEDLYDNLLRLMERRKIKLLNDEKVRLSLKSVQWEVEIKDNQPSRIKIYGNYTHIVEGLIRAAWAIKEKSLNVQILWV